MGISILLGKMPKTRRSAILECLTEKQHQVKGISKENSDVVVASVNMAKDGNNESHQSLKESENQNL